MDLLHTTLLAVLQGITEFLPVSSSGHLVAAQALLDVNSPGVLLEVSLHFGTLLAIVFVFRHDLRALIVEGCRGVMLLCRGQGERMRERAPAFFMVVAILVGSVPAGLAGAFLKGLIVPFFEGNLAACGVFMVVTGLMLLGSRCARAGRVKEVGPGRGLLVGLGQALALLPGISRSGSTIAVGLYAGLERETAARFAFLLAVPAIAGATLLELAGGGAETGAAYWPLIVWGTVISAVVGVLSLRILLPLVRKGKLHLFAAYCIPVGTVLFAASFFIGSANGS